MYTLDDWRRKVNPFFRPPILVCTGIISLAALLMLLFLGEKSLWLDEAFSVTLAQQDWDTMWQVISETEANQGLYYLLLSLWSNIGTSEFTVRSLSVIFSLSTLPFIYLLGKRLFGVRIGLIAALLLAVNAFYVHYAQEARGYSLAVLLVTASSDFFVRSIESSTRGGVWVAYIITSSLAVYAHFFSLLILIVHAFSLVALRRDSVPWKGLLVSGIIIVLLLSPLLVFVLTTEGNTVDFITEPSIADIGDVFLALSGSDQNLSIGSYLLLLAYFIPCAMHCC